MQMAQAIASTAKAVGIGITSLSVIAYLALWGGQRQVHNPPTFFNLQGPVMNTVADIAGNSWHTLPISLLDQGQMCLIRTTNTASHTRIYTSTLLMGKSCMHF